MRDVWRSREPLPAVRLASQTTDSIAALRAFLQGEQYYRRLAFDSAAAIGLRAFLNQAMSSAYQKQSSRWLERCRHLVRGT